LRAERETGWINCHSGRVKWPAERAWSVTVGSEDIQKVAHSLEKSARKMKNKMEGEGFEVRCNSGHKFEVAQLESSKDSACGVRPFQDLGSKIPR
jgi:hypothetical protein